MTTSTPHHVVELVPGVSVALAPLDPVTLGLATQATARAMGQIGAGDPSVLRTYNVETEELDLLRSDRNVLAGTALYVAACNFADLLLIGWTGLTDTVTGQPLPVTPETIRVALRVATTSGAEPTLLQPFIDALNALAEASKLPPINVTRH